MAISFYVGESFANFVSLEIKVAKFQTQENVQFYKRDSRSITAAKSRAPKKAFNDALKYSELTYSCIHGGRQFKARGDGKRKTNTFRMDCKAQIKLRASENGETLVVKSLDIQHNHETKPELFRNLFHQRKLDETDKENVRHMINVKANKKMIQANVMQSTGKVVLLKDIHNLTHTLPAKSDDISILQDAVNELSKCNGAFVKILVDDDSQLTGVFFQDERMRKVFSEYPELICVDATYKVNDLRMPLYLLVVENGHGLSEVAGMWFLAGETEIHLQQVVTIFKEQNPNWTKIRTVITDKDMVERDVFRHSFPDASLKICLYHVLKSFRREITAEKMCITGHQRERVLAILQQLAYADTDDDYEKFKAQLVDTRLDKVVSYFMNSWDNIKNEWVVGLTCDVSLGNKTNNRVESINQKIKQVVDTNSKLDKFAADLVNFLNAHRTEINAKICKTANKIEITRQRQGSVEFRYQQIVTNYAFKLLLPEIKAFQPVELIEENSVFKCVQNKKTYEVTNITCTCAFHKQYQMPCRHILAFRARENIDLFDQQLVASRWTKTKNLDLLGTTLAAKEIQTESLRVNRKPKSQTEKFRQCFRITQRLASIAAEFSGPAYDVKFEQLQRLLTAWESGEDVIIDTISTIPNDQRETPRQLSSPSTSESESTHRDEPNQEEEETNTFRSSEASPEIQDATHLSVSPTPIINGDQEDETPCASPCPIAQSNGKDRSSEASPEIQDATHLSVSPTPIINGDQEDETPCASPCPIAQSNGKDRSTEVRPGVQREIHLPIPQYPCIEDLDNQISCADHGILPSSDDDINGKRKREFLAHHDLVGVTLPAVKKGRGRPKGADMTVIGLPKKRLKLKRKFKIMSYSKMGENQKQFLLLTWIVGKEKTDKILSSNFQIEEDDILTETKIPTACSDTELAMIKKHFSPSAWFKLSEMIDTCKSMEWQCKVCGETDDTRCVACDCCNEWLHYHCAEISAAPKSKIWFCQSCTDMFKS